MKKVLILILCLLPVSAQAKMIKGKIVSLRDGTIFEMELEKKWAHTRGKIIAINPSTEERFTGDYTTIRQKTYGGVFEQAFDKPSNSAEGSGFGTSPSSAIPAQATLVGDKQNVLKCEFTFQGGVSTHGGGQCEDSKGNGYGMQF